MRKLSFWLIVVSVMLAAAACGTRQTASPAPSSATAVQPTLTQTSSPAVTTPAIEETTGEACSVSAPGLTAYKRPSTQAEVFGQVPDDSPLRVSGLTQDGWIGFEPGVAQGGNVGIFRLRWLPPGSGSLQGECGNLATLPSLPANVCFTMAMGEVALHRAASAESAVTGSLQLNAYARVVSRTPDGWLELDLSVSSLGISGPGWIQATAANFNGPCGRFGPELDASPIARLSPGSEIELEHVSMVDLGRGWAIGGLADEDAHVLRTEDGGMSWADITPPEPAAGEAASPKKASADFHRDGRAQIAYWYSDPAHAPLIVSLWVTDDWGSTWQSAGTRQFQDLPEAEPLIDFDDRGDGLLLIRSFVGMGSHAYSLLASSDGGQNYSTLREPQDTVDTCQRTGLVLFDANEGWMTGACPFLAIEGALLEMTGDGGQSWEQADLPTPPLSAGEAGSALFCEAVDAQIFSSAEGLLLVRCQGDLEKVLASFLYATTDGGQSWQVLSAPAGALYFLDRQHGWALGFDLFWTVDGGQTWQPRKSVIWQGAFSFIDAEHGWAIARSADEVALVRTTDGGASWSLIEPIIASP